MFGIGDEFLEHNNGVFDLVARTTVDRYPSVVIEELHPEQRRIFAIAARILDQPDLPIADARHRNFARLRLPLRKTQQPDIRPRDAQLEKRLRRYLAQIGPA